MKTNTYKRFVTATAASVLVVSAVAPVGAADQEKQTGYSYSDVWEHDSKSPFSDVPFYSSHLLNIMDAKEIGIMTGYNDGTFKPDQKLNRGNVVKAFGKYLVGKSGLGLEEYVQEHSINEVENFVDVPDDWADSELVTYSKIVKKAGIFKGSNNKLQAEKLMPRDQIAEVLVRAFDLQDQEGTAIVTDIEQSGYAKSIEIVIENGVSNVRAYRPLEATSRGQFASFMVRAYKVSEGLDPQAPYPFPVESIGDLPDITVNSGETPELPETVKITLASGIKLSAFVKWNMENFIKDEIGSYTLTGEIAGSDQSASINVIVRNPEYQRVRNISVEDNVIKISYPHNIGDAASDRSSYRLNGKELPSETRIWRDREGNVEITIPKPQQTIPTDIEYKFEITQNVQTKDGDIIVDNAYAANKGTEEPVNVSVTGVFLDNVAPTLVSADYVVQTADDKTSSKIQLTFSEELAPIFLTDLSGIDTAEPEGEYMWFRIENDERFEQLQDDFALKVNGTEAKVEMAHEDWGSIVDGNKLYFYIPETRIDRDSTITIVPEGKENKEMKVRDTSAGRNPAAPVTKTITKENVVVITPNWLLK